VAIAKDIEKKLTAAQKQRNEVEISTLRLLLSALKNYEIANKREPLTDEAVMKVIKTETRKREESIAAYKAGNRNELAEREQQELEILKTFLPAELSTEEIRQIVQSVIDENRDPARLNFGRVMGETMKRVGPRGSGNLVSQVVKEQLAKPKA